jgi:hypothetical protein
MRNGSYKNNNMITILAHNNSMLSFKINNLKKNNVIKFILLLISILTIIFPLSLLFFEQLEIGLSYVITLFIFFGTSIYFLRVYLWNYHGGEVFNFNNKSLEYYFDFSFFKSNLKSIKFDKLEVGYSSIDDPDSIIIGVSNKELIIDSNYYLGFLLNGNLVRSYYPVPAKDIIHISSLLKQVVLFRR